MIHVRFMPLTGKFITVREEKFADRKNALIAVEAHAATGGYTNIKIIDDDMGVSWRYTAKTPGGRGGRNIAFGDLDEDYTKGD